MILLRALEIITLLFIAASATILALIFFLLRGPSDEPHR
jgi:hypothetical protein